MEETPASEIQSVERSGEEGATPAPPPAAAPAAAQVAPTPPQGKVMPAEWPCQGYTGPQPWDSAVENTPTLTQENLMVSAGAAGPEVEELGGLLGALGYPNTITSGQNPHAIYDTGVSDAWRQFCADYGFREDPVVLRARTEDTVGPWGWEALTRAVHKKLAGQEA